MVPFGRLCVVLKTAMRYVDVGSQECSDMDDVKEHGSVGGCRHESVGGYGSGCQDPWGRSV